MTHNQYKPERVYLIAKVTGLPTELVQMKYRNAKARFESLGFEPVIPTEICDPDDEWHTAMRKCVPALCGCDYYATLDEPHTTPGGFVEHTIASWLKIPELIIPDDVSVFHEINAYDEF
jgi:hypothetical protein